MVAKKGAGRKAGSIRQVHPARSMAGYICGPNCQHHGGRSRKARLEAAMEHNSSTPRISVDETLDSWNQDRYRHPAAEKRAQIGGHEMAVATKTSKTTKTGRAATKLAKAVNEFPANKKAPKLTEAEAKKQIMADRMAHAREVSKAKREAAAKANENLTLADVKAAKKAKKASAEPVANICGSVSPKSGAICELAPHTEGFHRGGGKKWKVTQVDREAAAAAEMRLRDMSKTDQAERTEQALLEAIADRAATLAPAATERITPAGHGAVFEYFQAECPCCGTVVKVPVNDRGRRIPTGDLELNEQGILVGNPANAKVSKKAMSEAGLTKTGRAKREFTPEQRQAIADRLQGARAAKLGLTLAGLRAIKLRPGQTPTPAQLKKYGVKKSGK